MNFQDLKKELLKLDLDKYNGFHLDNGTIINANQFVHSHISFLESNTKNIVFMAYYERLVEFYNKTKKNDSETVNKS